VLDDLGLVELAVFVADVAALDDADSVPVVVAAGVELPVVEVDSVLVEDSPVEVEVELAADDSEDVPVVSAADTP
jgi:hypothetical protein